MLINSQVGYAKRTMHTLLTAVVLLFSSGCLIASPMLMIPEKDLGGTLNAVGLYSGFDGTYLGNLLTRDSGTLKNAVQGPDGHLYVSDQLNDNVLKFTAGGHYLNTFADSSDGLDNVRGIDFFGSNLYVTSANEDVVAAFDSTGNRLTNFIASIPNAFDIFFLPDGRSLVSDWDLDTVSLYDATGVLVTDLLTNSDGVRAPEQINQIGSNLYAVADFSASTIFTFDLSGLVSSIILDGGNISGLRGVHALRNGNLLVTNNSGVYEVTTAGSLVEQERTGSFHYIEQYSVPVPSTIMLLLLGGLATRLHYEHRRQSKTN